jgi:hypothetical protein
MDLACLGRLCLNAANCYIVRKVGHETELSKKGQQTRP